MEVDITEYKPGEPLNNFIETFWYGDFNKYSRGLLKQKVIPNGYVELILHLTDHHCDLIKNDTWLQSPDYTVIGLYTRPYEVRFEKNVKVFGIRFKPEGIYNVFGIPASEFIDNYDDLEMVLGPGFKEYCNKLREAESIKERLTHTETYLLNSMNTNKYEPNYLNRAFEIIRRSKGIVKIEDISGRAYISLRQLEREFKNKVGISPKLYMRISRLNEVKKMMDAGLHPDLTKITYECGYSDQAHFIRDFKSFTGIKPKMFIKNRNQFIAYT